VNRGFVVQEQNPLGDLPHVQIFMNDGPNPLTRDAQLLSYLFSRNPAVFQDSVLRLRELGQLRTYQHPLVCTRLSLQILWQPLNRLPLPFVY
jgi:hypothetical protein